MNKTYDVVIVGGGAVGCAIARELSRYKLKTALIEKDPDVAGETSGRNSAVVHAGFNNRTGSLMAKLCVEGNQGFEELCRELDVPYKKTGKFLVAFDEEDERILEGLIKKGEANGCKGLRMVSAEELHEILPGVGGISAMISPETAIFDPFLYTIALAENAVKNGVEVFLSHEVTAIDKTEGGFTVTAGGEEFNAKVVINSAGLGSAKVAKMAGIDDYEIYPCRGEYFILDTIADEYLKVPVYPAPKPGIGGLGVHLTPTIHGNVIIGPSAEYLDDGSDYSVTAPILDKLWKEAHDLLPALKRSDIIGGFAGIRPKQAPPTEGGYHDFIIKEEEALPGFIDLIGIESPGLTASVPIARMVCGIVGGILPLTENEGFDGTHKAALKFKEQTPEKQAELIKENPDYGEVVCRCQTITKQEIKDAIENPLGVHTLAGLKYRAWCMTGRCQGGYCLGRIVEILRDEYGIEPEDVRYRGEGSYMFVKGGAQDEE
ncbi:MAG: NAD(P)/FAD-dependent oxidoreductase [Eubacteriales bacterium]|nr:NAD(P)/FAD-dependent oxidoreductase [Eubacteriales bacterium]